MAAVSAVLRSRLLSAALLLVFGPTGVSADAGDWHKFWTIAGTAIACVVVFGILFFILYYVCMRTYISKYRNEQSYPPNYPARAPPPSAYNYGGGGGGGGQRWPNDDYKAPPVAYRPRSPVREQMQQAAPAVSLNRSRTSLDYNAAPQPAADRGSYQSHQSSFGAYDAGNNVRMTPTGSVDRQQVVLLNADNLPTVNQPPYQPPYQQTAQQTSQQQQQATVFRTTTTTTRSAAYTGSSV